MDLYGQGNHNHFMSDDPYNADGGQSEQKQGGFQPQIKFKNEFGWKAYMTHFKDSPKLISVGKNYSYGISGAGELLCWSTEEKKGENTAGTIDFKSSISDGRGDSVISKVSTLAGGILTGGILGGGKDLKESKQLMFSSIYTSNRGDFSIFTTFEGVNFLYMQKHKVIEPLVKLKRTINALKFVEVLNEEERSVIKLICTSSNHMLSCVLCFLISRSPSRSDTREKINPVRSR